MNPFETQDTLIMQIINMQVSQCNGKHMNIITIQFSAISIAQLLENLYKFCETSYEMQN